MVGYASAGRERTHDREYAGEAYAIYVLPAAQGKVTDALSFGRTLARSRQAV